MAAALKLEFWEIKFVSVLNCFTNFKDSVDVYLNEAAKTEALLSHNVHFQVPSSVDQFPFLQALITFKIFACFISFSRMLLQLSMAGRFESLLV